jgi:hypothetical protein
MFSPKQEYFIFGRPASDELAREREEDYYFTFHRDREGWDTHAEDYDNVRGQGRLAPYDEHLRGWIAEDSSGDVWSRKTIHFYRDRSSDDPAETFDATMKAIERFIRAGADEDTRVTGLQHLIKGKPDDTTLGEAFPSLFRP